MLAALILFPLFFAALAFLLPWYQGRSWMLPLAGTLHLLLASFLVARQAPVAAPGAWIGLDSLSKLVLLVTSLLFFCCSFYAVEYLKLHRARGNKVMAPCLLIFLSAMTLSVVSRHLGLSWMAVETTTIVSAPLIYYNRNRLSIEATWKYLLICSVGIALAMFGILFVAYSALGGAGPVSLQFDKLLAAAPTLAAPWLHAGFVFLLVGFGTKVGLAPLHTWKPDAYGEAPAMIGALLSGGLTTVAFLAIMRAVQLMGAAGDLTLARHALLGMGLLSLLLAAVFMVRQPDIKRMLAYSSVEHMGILAIGIGIGGLATYGALLHLINNSMTKGCLFLSAGNIQRTFGSKNLSQVRGAIAAVPVSGTLFLIGFLAVTGSPPFGLFMSEFTILRGIFGGGHTVVGVAFLTLLAMIFIGMGTTVLAATQGESKDTQPLYKDRFLLVAPPLIMILIVLLLGLYIPDSLSRLLQSAANLLEGKS
jgi:hydrogenase-4 component F